MNATCKWYVSANNIDDGMMRDAIRKNVKDKKSVIWWLDQYVDSRSPINDSNPDDGVICSLEVRSLDDLMIAVGLMRTAQAYCVTVECEIDATAVRASAVIGPTEEKTSASIFPQAVDKNATFRVICDIEERCEQLREHLLSIEG